MTSLVENIQTNLRVVEEKISNAVVKSGRAAGDVRLVVVTKTHRVETLRAAAEAGAKIFGENYVEEAHEKMSGLSDLKNIEWHMIGHIQSRKAEEVAGAFGLIHSLDSIKLAERLNRFAGVAGIKLQVLIECNVSGETSKFGISAWNEAHIQKLFFDIEKIIALPNLELRGLMTMPPYFMDPEQARPYFENLRELRGRLRVKFSQARWQELSMGTSADYQVAVEEGATLVRIGTAILGEREYL